MNINLFPTVILAGGLATRLRPLTQRFPKTLVLINGRPFIEHQLHLLHSQGIRDVIICVGYLGEMIEDHLDTGAAFGMRITYVYDSKIASENDVALTKTLLRGTAGAIKNALPLLPQHFFVLYGDSYLNCDYAAIQNTFVNSGKAALMTVFHNQGQWDSSNVEYSNGKILAYDKDNRTARMQHIDYGLGLFSKQAFQHVPAETPYDLAALYQTLLHQQQLCAYEVLERFYEIGSFAGIKELEYYLSLHDVSLKEEGPCNS